MAGNKVIDVLGIRVVAVKDEDPEVVSCDLCVFHGDTKRCVEAPDCHPGCKGGGEYGLYFVPETTQ